MRQSHLCGVGKELTASLHAMLNEGPVPSVADLTSPSPGHGRPGGSCANLAVFERTKLIFHLPQLVWGFPLTPERAVSTHII